MNIVKKFGYIALIVVISTLLFSIPFGYDYLNEKNSEEINTYVSLALNSDDPTSKLDELIKDYIFDISVSKGDYLYSTTGLDIEQSMNINFEQSYYVESDQINGFDYILIIPPIDFDVYYEYFIIIELIIVLLILVWVIITIKYITKTLIKPLEALKNNIVRLKDFELSSLDKEQQDKINKELLEFSDELTYVIESYNKDISKSQLDIEKNESIIELQRQYLLTSIHDMKNEVRNIKYSTNDPNVCNLVDNIIANSEEIINTYIDDNNYDFSIKDKIILDQTLFKILQSFTHTLDEQDVSVSLHVKGRIIYENDALVRQLFTNIISNCAKHTDFMGEIEIYATDDYLVFKNTHAKPIDIDKIFDVSYSTSENSKLGFGMSRILELSKQLNYNLVIDQEGENFILKLSMRYYND